MHSTADKILEQWTGHRRQYDGTYRGNSPLRPGSDSWSFVLRIEDGEHGAYTDHVSKESGSLYDLAEKMGIELPKSGRNEVSNTKTEYENLEDYANRHFAPVDYFIKYGWQDTVYLNRKAITWKTQSGIRARFIDSEATKNVYRWVGDNDGNCWYGLDRAINRANELSSPIVLCNGEASTICASYHGIPAFCGTGGEGSVSDDMLSELSRRWGGQVVIALDCDTPGREASNALIAKINKAVVIDLGLSDGGDLADFCGLHGDSALSSILKMTTKELSNLQVMNSEFIEFVDNYSLLSTFQKFVLDDPSLFGRVVKMPFKTMRQSGGFADIMTTKKIWFNANVSGGGKTIWSEVLCDNWNIQGSNVFYIGDEWTEMEFVARQVQRATESHIINYMDYLHYADGTRQFTESEINSNILATRNIRAREGRTYVMKVNNAFHGVVFLEDIMEAVANKIETLRANGIIIDVIVLDYLSLYDTKADKPGNNLEEYKAGILKSWCKSLDVLGVSTVQVNKTSEDRVIQKGGYLTQHDMYWIRPDKGNLISTMNRIYRTNFEMNKDLNHPDEHPKGRKPYIDSNGLPLETPNLCVVTSKNSVASPHEYTYFHFDFARMRIVEGLHPDYHFDMQFKMILPNNHPKADRSNAVTSHYTDNL